MISINSDAVIGLIGRTIGEHLAGGFDIHPLKRQGEHEAFELESIGERVVIRGTSESAAASGFHWYLKYNCNSHVSWCGDRVDVPSPLPAVTFLHKETPFRLRYNLNYCTFSYSMAFWNWERWERELDWMALNGINLALSLVGHEEVWRRLLTRFGYSIEETKQFICGPAFLPWQWMQNMTSWGGPLPDWWFKERVELARNIHDRMLSLGIEPILQGYSGMVPADFKMKYPDSSPVNQGKWCQFDRPSLLLPTDPMYGEIASAFYEIQKELFGDVSRYYSTDPFHEGGSTEGIDVSAYACDVQQAMLDANPDAVWVLQAWQDNPKDAILQGLDRSRTLVLDLWCESDAAWKRRDAFGGTPWIWCMIQNYGGKNGLFGNLDLIASELPAAVNDPASGAMAGVGLAMEGIETNPIMYDLMTDMVWRGETPDMENWLASYISRRYGATTPDAASAWSLLHGSVYRCDIVQQGAMESIICARPSLEITSVSTWGPAEYYYLKRDVRRASKLLYECYDRLSGSEGYLYDLVDVTRQALADMAREVYQNFVNAYHNRNKATFEESVHEFLHIVLLQDKLLGTRKEFLLGRWIDQARSWGREEGEKDWLEFNARTLITLWGPKEPQTSLHDYSHREWSGLISDFYYPRWCKYFSDLRQALEGNEEPQPNDWYAWEYRWTLYTNHFPVEPEGDLKRIMEDIIPLFES